MASRKLNGASTKDLLAKVDMDQTIPHRAADILNEAARLMPKRCIDKRDFVKMVLALGRRPAEDSKDVEFFFKSKWGRVKVVLYEKHGRAGITVPGKGVRATTSDEDAAGTDLRGKVRRFKSAAAGVRRSAELVNPTKVKNPELKKFAKDVHSFKKVISEDELERRLRLPDKTD